MVRNANIVGFEYLRRSYLRSIHRTYEYLIVQLGEYNYARYPCTIILVTIIELSS